MKLKIIFKRTKKVINDMFPTELQNIGQNMQNNPLMR
jgi:hypothetical protein